MEHSAHAYLFLARSPQEEVFVEILRGSVSLINFTVPWSTRRTGYLLSSPSEASRLDPWKNIESINNGSGHSLDNLHICVPGLDSAPNIKTLALLLEFIQHHLLLGVDHIFLTATYTWESPYMKLILEFLGSFIDDGKVSIATQAGDGIDLVNSFSGMSWGRDNVKNFASNIYLYLSKGSSK
jgi:hypothetical protein